MIDKEKNFGKRLRDPQVEALNDEHLDIAIQSVRDFVTKSEEKIHDLEEDQANIIGDASQRHRLAEVADQLSVERISLRLFKSRLKYLLEEQERRDNPKK